MTDLPDWKRADLIALGSDEVPPLPDEPKKERATRKTASERAVKE